MSATTHLPVALVHVPCVLLLLARVTVFQSMDEADALMEEPTHPGAAEDVADDKDEATDRPQSVSVHTANEQAPAASIDPETMVPMTAQECLGRAVMTDFLPTEPNEEQPTGQEVEEVEEMEHPVPGATTSLYCERVARAIRSGFVKAARSSTRDGAEPGCLSTDQTVQHFARVAPTTPAAPVVRSRLLDYENSARFLAQREANVARAQAIREESAIAKTTRFH